jgi:hypothetical protein
LDSKPKHFSGKVESPDIAASTRVEPICIAFDMVRQAHQPSSGNRDMVSTQVNLAIPAKAMNLSHCSVLISEIRFFQKSGFLKPHF